MLKRKEANTRPPLVSVRGRCQGKSCKGARGGGITESDLYRRESGLLNRAKDTRLQRNNAAEKTQPKEIEKRGKVDKNVFFQNRVPEAEISE